MKYLWLGEIFNICEQYMKKDTSKDNDNNIYIFMLYFIHHKCVTQLHEHEVEDYVWDLVYKKKKEKFKKIIDLQDQIDQYKTLYRDEYNDRYPDFENFTHLPIWDNKNPESTKRLCEILQRWSLYLWFGMEKRKLDRILRESYELYKKHEK
jgi:hypothetical protein